MLELVLDTNVLVAALRSSLGASHRLLETLEQQVWHPVISLALALEYEAVLKRGAVEIGLTLSEIDELIEYLCSRSRLIQVYFLWRPVLHDADDDRILELAVRAGCTIVTFNSRHFAGAERFGVSVMSPKEALALIGGRK